MDNTYLSDEDLRIKRLYRDDTSSAASIDDWRSVELMLENPEQFPQSDLSLRNLFLIVVRDDRDDILEMMINEYPEIMEELGPMNMFLQALDNGALSVMDLLVRVYDIDTDDILDKSYQVCQYRRCPMTRSKPTRKNRHDLY